ncbi:ECM29 protein [Xylaria bambusicola]|uniref:ECM29 protein n=1 Tax=Xylaria bambusicola TaxID=326684 RepID=UPI0020089A2C|nr:ECM29 protein [Xylaria bambusicola]KAI0502906.1 ECM29 protein [Xylaria bambusicola]
MAASNEATELKLVSSIRYKFASASGDEKKLSQALQSQLTSLLEKAGSQHKAVREDTFKAFMSVKNFVQPAGVVLPVAALLEQYKQTTSPIVKQLDLSFIREGMSRLDQTKRRALLPVILRDISKESNSASAAGFFNIFLRLLLEIKVPGRGTTEDLALREAVGLANPSDAKYVATWLGKLSLLRQDIALAPEEEIPSKLEASPSGLTKENVAFLRNKDPKSYKPDVPNSLSLPECKLKAVGFLASGAFTDDERYLPMICAAGSADSRISSIADDVIKRADIDLENEDVIQSLFAAHSTFPAPHRIQILRLLSKSATACAPKQRVVDAVKEDFSLTTDEKPVIVGLEALRLHKALLGFLSWIARNSSETENEDTKMGPALVTILKDYILGQGWPAPNLQNNQSRSQDEQRLRAHAYETIGTLARASKLDHKAKDSLLKWLFDSLVSDPSPDIVVYIEGALSSMMSLFKSTDTAQHRDLEILLLEYMNVPERQNIRTARHVAVRFANNCLPYNNITARWLSIVALSASSSERRDILEEGQRGLDPWWATKLHPEEELKLPDWAELTKFLFDSTTRQIEEHEMAVDQISKYTLYTNDRLQAFSVAIRFAKQILLLAALAEDTLEIDWEARLNNRIRNDLAAQHSIRKYIKTIEAKPLLLLLNAALDGLRDHPEVGAEDSLDCLADILSFAPTDTIISTLSGRAHELLALRGSNNQRVRQLASKTFGILAPWADRTSLDVAQLREFLSSTDEPPASLSAQYQCSLVCLASCLSKAAYYGRLTSPEAASHIEFVVRCSLLGLRGSDAGVQNAALDSLAQLWTADLGWPSQENDLNTIIDCLASLAVKGNERSIYALGRLSIPKSSDVLLNGESPARKVLEKLFSLSDIKRTEVHFAIGEAIAAAIARWDSDSVQLSIDVQAAGHGEDIIKTLRKKPDQVSDTLNKFITDSKQTKPSLIKASGIWLFCVIQYCSGLPDIQSRLRECQIAFMRLLTARDELVQETASRGLALVYEKGDQSLKGDLVKDLVASFTGTNTQLKVDDDTELFDAGALPTGEGKSITSYKDIINLANEVGDQSLIYKFMALATNAATWTARSAFGRFGLSTILSDAELDPKIYPKLYRYRFDPNPNVRRSMEDIWKAVVKDQTLTIDVHFDSIMTDLLKSILDGREWRVREASCAAIADLIYGQPYLKYEKYYTDIWQVALRVLDDQKGSVRESALKLCIGLSKTLVSQLKENNSSSSTQAMIAQVLPFLLSDKGIENSVKEVKLVAITTVLDVVKNGGDTLKPFIPTITTHFLGLLSTVEPDQINYYYQRVSEEDREGLDRLRSQAATRSPLFECIADCLRFTDDAVMSQLAPQLVATIKSALGMQTKIGCSEVLSTLALRHSIYLTPYSALFVKSLHAQILDRNNEVSKAYAKSAAYLLRSASPETRDRYINRLVDLYFAAEDEVRRQKVGDAVLAIAKVSPDAFTDLETQLLPFAYFAKFDTDEYVSEVCEAAWNQHAGGHHTVRRYVNEISVLVSKGLETSKWALQHAAAFTVASMITALSNAAGKDGQFSESVVRQIWPVLDKTLSLKTFKGKEKLIAAYPVFIRHSKKFWEGDTATSAQTKKIALREAKRNNDEYRPHAFEALADYAAVREDVDMYAEVVTLVSDYLTPDTEAHKLTELERKTTEAALKTVITAYNRPRMRSAPASILSDVATTIEGAKQSISIAKDTLFTYALDLLDQAAKSAVPTSTDESLLAKRWFNLLLHDESNVALESQRTARAKALLAFVTAWEKGVFGLANEQVSLKDDMGQKLAQMKTTERSLDVQRILDQASQKFKG